MWFNWKIFTIKISQPSLLKLIMGSAVRSSRTRRATPPHSLPTLSCRIRVCLVEYVTHKCFSPVWKNLYVFKLTNWANAFSHRSHLIDFFPVWLSLWFPKVDNWANDFSHMSHLNGFSLVWLCLCLDKWGNWANSFWQKLQLYDFLHYGFAYG